MSREREAHAALLADDLAQLQQEAVKREERVKRASRTFVASLYRVREGSWRSIPFSFSLGSLFR